MERVVVVVGRRGECVCSVFCFARFLLLLVIFSVVLKVMIRNLKKMLISPPHRNLHGVYRTYF